MLAGWSVSSFYLISVTAQNRAHDHMNFFAVEGNLQLRFSVNVCCAVLDDQLIGPFILEGRLTGKAYLRFLQEELPRLLEDVSLNKQGRMYFRHDGAPPHSSREVINFLNYRFPGRWIGRGSPHNWPARSPDLSPLDYCVWGWMKELVYSVKVATPQTSSE